MRSKALRERASARSCRNRTRPAIDSRIAAEMIKGPYMAAAPFRWGLCVSGLARNIAHGASGVNRARSPSGGSGAEWLEATGGELGRAVGGDQDHGQAGGGLLRLLDRLGDRLALEALAEAGVLQVGGEQDEVGAVVTGVADQGVGAVVGGQPAPGVDAGLAGGGHLAGERLAAQLDQLLVGEGVAELGALGLGGPLVGHGVGEGRGRVAVVQD